MFSPLLPHFLPLLPHFLPLLPHFLPLFAPAPTCRFSPLFAASSFTLKDAHFRTYVVQLNHRHFPIVRIYFLFREHFF